MKTPPPAPSSHHHHPPLPMGRRQMSSTTLHLFAVAVATAAAASTEHDKKFETHTWGPFAQPSGFLNFAGDSSISSGALQITPDSTNGNFNLTHRAGRITYNRPFRILSAAASAASFTTNFTVNIFRPDTNATPGARPPPGEGLAFLIAAAGFSIPVASSGRWLGLTNATTDGNATNRFVAVELDTVRNPEVGDPDGNHLGLDINGVVSNVTLPLDQLDIELSPVDPVNYTVWIDYSGDTMRFEVYIAREHQPRPVRAAINKILDLGQIVGDEAYFGFSASTGDTAELNCVLFWNLSVEILPDIKDNMGLKLGLGIGLPVVVVVAAAAGVAGWWWRWKKRLEDDGLNIEGAIKSLPGMPREFKLRELKKATNGFDEDQKLGEGGFGVVYRGWVRGAAAGEPAKEVAVKKFLRENVKGMDDFLAELTIINRLRHKNLVKLVGWCHTNGMLLLVYDYMPNGSLDAHLFGDGAGDGHDHGRPLLSWDRRRSILADVAAALNYLHNEYNDTVVHRDLKASNILLDADFTARLGDFGLARALDGDRTSYANVGTGGVPGTLGYIAPECFHTGKATRESDVFGFGAVVLEVVCGRCSRSKVGDFYFLVDWVWSLHRDSRLLDAVDPRLAGDFPVGEAERLLKLGLACSHPIAGERPKTQAMVQIIAGSVPPPEVPGTKPAFVWPAAVSMDDVIDGEKSSSSYFGEQFVSRDNSYEDNSMVLRIN